MSDTTTVQEMLTIIDSKIDSLKKARAVIVKEFGDVNKNSQPSLLSTSASPKRSILHPGVGITRKQQIIKLMREEGPQRRVEIIKKTGMPRGTLSFVLKDLTTFVNKDGVWDLLNREEVE